MVWYRMVRVAVSLAWPDLFRPWRSPLMRWRMETFGVLDAHGRPMQAAQITPVLFVRFLMDRRVALWRFLRWAAAL